VKIVARIHRDVKRCYRLCVKTSYRIVNISHSDSLNVRAGPASTYPIVVKLAPGARGIKLGRGLAPNGTTMWQEISVGGNTGWVNVIYLDADQRTPVVTTPLTPEAAPTKTPSPFNVEKYIKEHTHPR
jgi:uncharacterized protein YraI